MERFRLRKVIFLPCAHSPLKNVRPVASDPARLAMLRDGLKGQGWAEVSDWETRQGGVSYTVDSVRALQRGNLRRKLFWIMGSDQWDLLPTWKEPGELRKRLYFLVFPRPERPCPRKGFIMREIPLRVDISATEIRRRIRKKNPIEGLVLPVVERMIRKNRWYL